MTPSAGSVGVAIQILLSTPGRGGKTECSRPSPVRLERTSMWEWPRKVLGERRASLAQLGSAKTREGLTEDAARRAVPPHRHRQAKSGTCRVFLRALSSAARVEVFDSATR
jgi:hypothetical protein